MTIKNIPEFTNYFNYIVYRTTENGNEYITRTDNFKTAVQMAHIYNAHVVATKEVA